MSSGYRRLARVAVDYAMTPELLLVGAIFGASRQALAEKNEAAFHLGLRHWLSSSLALDAAAGRSFRSSGASFQATAGLTWTIDLATLLKLRD